MARVSSTTTEFCVITGEGKGAIATTWVSGPAALDGIKRFFRPRSLRSLEESETGCVLYGDWIFDDGDDSESNREDRAHREDLIVVRLNEQTFEIHSHGGSQSRAWIGRSLMKNGMVPCSIDRYLARTSTSWLTKQWSQAVSRALTERSALLLLDQLSLWTDLIERLRDCCRNKDGSGLSQLLAPVLSWKDFGGYLTEPWRIVIAGHPNVGKSSLLNVLAGFSRAIVHDQPGTTRDVVAQRTAFDGWPVELSDTAGLRLGRSEIEALGIERAWAEVRNADCRIAVFDASQSWTDVDGQTLNAIQPQIIVFNKVDRLQEDSSRPAGLFTSTISKQGIEMLERAIVQVLVPEVPGRDQAVPFDDRLCERIERIEAAAIQSDWNQVRLELDDLATGAPA